MPLPLGLRGEPGAMFKRALPELQAMRLVASLVMRDGRLARHAKRTRL